MEEEEIVNCDDYDYEPSSSSYSSDTEFDSSDDWREDEVVAIESGKHCSKQPQKTQGVDNRRARKETDNKKKDGDSSKKEQVKSGSGGEEVVPSRTSHDNNGAEKKEKDTNRKKGSSSSRKKDPLKREGRQCPLKGCKSKVIHLPRHLRDVHQWTKEKAKNANSRFGLRESFKTKPVIKSESSETKRKDYHRHRPCPIPGCTSVVKRLSSHLKQMHKEIKPGSTEYKNTLREARSLKTWRPSGQGETTSSLPAPDGAQDDPSMNCTSACTSGSARKEEISDMKQVSEQSCQEDSVEESVPVYAAGEEENDIMQNAERDIENETVELDESIFSSFCQWLQTADGGRKDAKLSKQHASQLKRILTTIDPDENVNSLFDKNLIRDKFLKQHAEMKYTADTVKAYLLSLRHFCSYIIAETPKSIKVETAVVFQIEEKARLWSSSYKKDSNRRHLQKMNEDLGNLITPEMVTEYERSESARIAVSYIGQLSGAHSLVVSQAIYSVVRDFILLEITVANAHRSGVLSNMTVGEYKKAKRKEGSVVISVAKHKTSDTHGPARVVLSPKLFSYLQVYVQEVRSQVDNSSSDEQNDQAALFLSWNGSRLESGQISTAINAAWRKGGMEGHVHSTLFRKSAVTTVHAHHKELRGDLADLMAHKETTAKKFYRLHEKQEACLQAATQLNSIMRSSTERKTATNASNEVSDDDTPASPTFNEDRTCGSKMERISWKEEDVLAIKELFVKEIEDQSISITVVRERIHDHPTLQHLDPKKVVDRVRSEWRDFGQSKSQTQQVTDSEPPSKLPEDGENLEDKMKRFFATSDGSEDIVAPSNSSFVSGKLFNQEERNYLLKVCGSIVKSGVISKVAVQKILEKEKEGKEIFRKFTLDQIINRLKYEKRSNKRLSKAT